MAQAKAQEEAYPTLGYSCSSINQIVNIKPITCQKKTSGLPLEIP